MSNLFYGKEDIVVAATMGRSLRSSGTSKSSLYTTPDTVVLICICILYEVKAGRPPGPNILIIM